MEKRMKVTFGSEADIHGHWTGYLYVEYSVDDGSTVVTGRTKLPVAGYEKKDITPAELGAKLNELTEKVEKSYAKLLGILDLIKAYAERKEIDFSAEIKIVGVHDRGS
jgi:hypothetical protein